MTKDECGGDTYVSLSGVIPGVVRWKNIIAVKHCYMRFIKLFGPQDPDERMQRYTATSSSINTDLVSVCQGIRQM